MTPPAEIALRLSSSTAYFRVREGQHEMLLEYGSNDGPAYVVGRAELEAVVEHIQALLRHTIE